MLIVRLIVAVIVGLIVAGVLNLFGLLDARLNGLLGLLAAICVFFGWDGNWNHRV